MTQAREAFMPAIFDSDSVHVYIIGHDTGPKKIGMSKNPTLRHAYLRVDGCREMACLYHSEAFTRAIARRVERLTHLILDERHVDGEWFNVTVEEGQAAIATAITSVQTGEKLPIEMVQSFQMDIPDELMDALRFQAVKERSSIKALVLQALHESGYPVPSAFLRNRRRR
jgi:hypothetical protein